MSEQKNIMEYETVALDEEGKAVVILDQTKLTQRAELIRLKTAQEIWEAIYLLKVRGAPAIGVAAAFGIYVLADAMDTQDYDAFYAEFCRQKEYLDSARPTAVNLSWALARMENVVKEHADLPVAQIKELLRQEAVEIKEEDIRVNMKLSDLEERLPEYFVRVHQSYLVNMKQIRVFSAKGVELVDRRVIPVSRPRYAKAKDIFLQFLGEKEE